jgi:catechol 2,3-dioxygenase-like lactoylglutathione lyase family enzyme
MAKLSRIAPEIPVSNLPEAIKYYDQKLGFQDVFERPAGDYAIVERDGVAIHLFQNGTRRPLWKRVEIHGVRSWLV